MEKNKSAHNRSIRGIGRSNISLCLKGTLLLVLVWAFAGMTPTLASSADIEGTRASTSVQSIKIGVAADLSGPLLDLGWRQANSAQLAVDQVNASGGVDIGGTNYTVELIQADSGCDPTMGEAAANDLVNAGVVAVVGHTCSGSSLPASAIYFAAGVAMVSPSSTRPDVTEQGYDTTFRVISRDDSPPILLVTHFASWLGIKKAAVVELNGFWGNSVIDPAVNVFTALGGTITSRHSVNSTDEFDDALTAIKAEHPQAILYFDDNPGNAALLSKTAYDVGMQNVVIGWSPFTENKAFLDDYATQAGEAAEGDYAAMFYRNKDDMPGYADLTADYQASGFPNYGDEPGPFGAFAYDATRIVLAAIDDAESTDPGDIRDAIAATADFSGVVGVYEGFDAKGDVIPQWMWLEYYRFGRWVIPMPNLFLPVIQNP